MKIAVIGCGYVGLVTGACLANDGHHVVCIDNQKEKIDILLNNKIPIYEPGLEDIISNNLKNGKLSFELNIDNAASNAEVIFIAVGTPTDEETGNADLSQIYNCARELAGILKENALVIVKSTVPVGTCDEIEKIIKENNKHQNFKVLSNPEFLREGNAIYDFENPDRIIIGSDDDNIRDVVKEIYKGRKNEQEIVFTSRRSSELIKYASNSMLAMRIIFINEIADLCERVGADITDVAKGIGLDKRIGPYFLEPGPGFGGSCFPKDARALIESGKKYGAPQTLLESVIKGNESRKKNLSKKISEILDIPSENKIGVLGVTFKAETDDMREAPSLSILPDLINIGLNISVYDPAGMEEATKLIKNVKWVENPYEVANEASCIIILTDWQEFKELDLNKIKNAMKRPLIYDFRNIYNPDNMKKLGFEYHSIGRG